MSTRSMPSIAADGVEAYTHHQPRLVKTSLSSRRSCSTRLNRSMLLREMFVEKTTMPGAGMIGLMPKYDPLRDNERQMSFTSNWSGYIRIDTSPFNNRQELASDIDLKSDDGGVRQVL